MEAAREMLCVCAEDAQATHRGCVGDALEMRSEGDAPKRAEMRGAGMLCECELWGRGV